MMKKYVVLYYTKAGYLGAWTEHDDQDEALEKARQRALETGRPHWVSRVETVVEAATTDRLEVRSVYQ